MSTSCTRLMPSTVTKNRRPAEKARGMKTQLLVRLPMTWAGCGGGRVRERVNFGGEWFLLCHATVHVTRGGEQCGWLQWRRWGG